MNLKNMPKEFSYHMSKFSSISIKKEGEVANSCKLLTFQSCSNVLTLIYLLILRLKAAKCNTCDFTYKELDEADCKISNDNSIRDNKESFFRALYYLAAFPVVKPSCVLCENNYIKKIIK